MKYCITLVIATFFLMSCRSEYTSEDLRSNVLESSEEYAVEADEASVDETSDIQESIPKKIIKNGYMEMEANNLFSEKRRVDSLINAVNGYYEDERLENTTQLATYTLTIRIPAERFEQFIATLEDGDSEVKNKYIEARDVTEEYIDLETRLANKRSYIARYQELLKVARNVQEILEIQERLRKLEEEVESTMGRLKYLSGQVSFSKLHLEISQKKAFRYSPSKRADVSEKLKQSVYGGWHQFVDFLYILLYNWVLILFIIIIIVFLLIRRRRIRRARKAAKT